MTDTNDEARTAIQSAESPDADRINAALAAELERVIATGEDHILQYFRWSHLPAALGRKSALFGTLALQIVSTTPRNPERTVALRKLLEAKDAAVRAGLA